MTGKKSITYKFYKAPHTRLSLETTKCARLLISIPWDFFSEGCSLAIANIIVQVGVIL